MSGWTSILIIASNLAVSGSDGGLTGAPNLFSSAVRMVSALAITLGILFFIVYLLKRFGSNRGRSLGSRKLIRVISTTYLGSRRSLVLADVAGEKYVLGLSPQAITVVAKIDSEESLERISTAEENGQTGKPFHWYLDSLMGRHHPSGREGDRGKE